MLAQPILSTTKDDPMQIDETRFKHLIEQEKQRWCNIYVYIYCGRPSHVVYECLKKPGPHTTHATFLTNSKSRK